MFIFKHDSLLFLNPAAKDTAWQYRMGTRNRQPDFTGGNAALRVFLTDRAD